MNTLLQNRRFGLLGMSVLSAALAFSGCGQSAYEERLTNSRLLYEYLQSVEDALSNPPWIRSDLGISMRLPRPFQNPMPGPESFRDKEGDVTYGPDPRQKNSLNIELPGLVEAWEAALDSTDGQPDAWIYVLTNQDRFPDADQGGLDPAEFLKDVENDLMRVFQVTVPEGETSKIEDNVRFRQQIPAPKSDRAQYTTPKDYTVIRYVPNAEYNSADLQAALYERKAGPVQVAVIVLTRKTTTAAFRQRLEIALETMEVAEVIPRRPNPTATPTSPGAATPSSPSSGTRAPARAPSSGF